jgi:large subunit ribosomal protein L6
VYGGVEAAMTAAMTISRVGRKPIAVPSGVEVKMQEQKFSVKGPKGNLAVAVHPFVRVTVEANQITIHPNAENTSKITGSSKKLYRSIVGTARASINNLIYGVTHGFERRLTLIGVGYRAQSKGKVLALSLGFSHPTEFAVPEGITIETPTQTEIIIKGVNKQVVGEVAATIRKIRGPEPYKGKGIRYANEVIELKETKKK